MLETAYESLTPARRALLGRIACFRGPVSYDALQALVAEPPHPVQQGEDQRRDSLDANLHDLIARGLLHHDRKANRFDLHPIVRRYAYDRLTSPDRTAIHTRLYDYFAAVPMVDKVSCLEDLALMIELYHHTVRAGQLVEACILFHDRLHDPLYYQLGTYQLIIDLLRALFLDGEDRPSRLKYESVQCWTLIALANAYSLTANLAAPCRCLYNRTPSMRS